MLNNCVHLRTLIIGENWHLLPQKHLVLMAAFWRSLSKTFHKPPFITSFPTLANRNIPQRSKDDAGAFRRCFPAAQDAVVILISQQFMPQQVGGVCLSAQALNHCLTWLTSDFLSLMVGHYGEMKLNYTGLLVWIHHSWSGFILVWIHHRTKSQENILKEWSGNTIGQQLF